MKKITLLDTSICTENIGDKIIMDSVNKEVKEIFQDSFYVRVPTHDIIGKPSYEHMNTSDAVIACGTNLLSSNMNKYNQWKIGVKDAKYVNNVTLFGVGWWQYQEKPNGYTARLLRKVLSDKNLHSVRDNYTKEMLNSIGIENVITTACPTMWRLDPEHCAQVPKTKGKSVLVTLTDYNKVPEKDGEMLEILKKNYDKVYFWIQAWEDYEYVRSITDELSIEFVSPTLDALDSILSKNEEIDYVGTRLHAGIRALQHKRRTIIIGIDNRALEKSKDFNLTVVDRKDIADLEGKINSEFTTTINIPLENINKWKKQFN
ncbi:polysaccharide pyruvyl transferase family protein [Radiobacillus sp. PE A8.2]|uniref:polysaccharide pyruvyl transferase family protein n=1 Tax=Radiobacillus sp. PE A8.2 TaxID=3380349 RepID=UPI00388FE69A